MIKKTLLLSGFSQKLAIFLLLFFILISLWLIFEYAAKERDRDLMNWQSRLALLAEIRAADVEDLLISQKNQLQYLASNPSLKLYLSQQESSVENNQNILNAQQGHVRNLLRATAEKFNFAGSITGKNQVNINKPQAYGLAISGAKKQLLMSTRGFPANPGKLQKIIESVYKTATEQIIDFYSDESKQPVYGYIIPVFKIQDLQSRTPVGAVILLLNPQNTLYKTLENRQSITHSDESLLVKTSGSAITYLSPIKNDYKLFHQLADNNNLLAASFALHNPGGFAQMKDYLGNTVLVTGRKIQNTSWSLVQKISSDEALAESNKHQTFLLTTFTLFILIVATAFIAIWRHSTSIRLQLLSDTLEAHTALLDAVTDNINEKIILVDKNTRINFINQTFAHALDIDASKVRTATLSNILGKETANVLENSVCAENSACVIPLEFNNRTRIYHVMHTRMTSAEHEGSTLYVLHDISEIKKEQEKREKLGRGIISTLVKAVDLHDPYCINHSERTRQVATEIAREMQLGKEQLESLEMASLLANIGKLFVPKEILTKMDALSETESIELKRHIEYAVEILSDLSFTGPVVDIIAQKNERMDGSGYPKGISGDEILPESRILAVANSFVAMASSRAYRQGRDIKEVVDILLSQSESQYDRHVVAALFHIAENKTDWKTWQTINQS